MKTLLDTRGTLSLWRYHTDGVPDVFSIRCNKCQMQFAGGSEGIVRSFWVDLAGCIYCNNGVPTTATRGS